MTKTLEAGLREQIARLERERDGARGHMVDALTRASRYISERDAALAQVEALRKPLEFPWPEAPERLMAFLALRNSALAALSSAPAPAVYTRERVERALKAYEQRGIIRGGTKECRRDFWATLDAHPEEVKP